VHISSALGDLALSTDSRAHIEGSNETGQQEQIAPVSQSIRVNMSIGPQSVKRNFALAASVQGRASLESNMTFMHADSQLNYRIFQEYVGNFVKFKNFQSLKRLFTPLCAATMNVCDVCGMNAPRHICGGNACGKECANIVLLMEHRDRRLRNGASRSHQESQRRKLFSSKLFFFFVFFVRQRV
jgi:hypothetical protein